MKQEIESYDVICT